jgi:NAD(P)H-dependent FMN reductase
MDRHFLFLLSSARREGNSQRLARAAADCLSPVAQSWIDLTDLALPPYHDLRPATELPQGALAGVMAAMRAASDIVLVAPVYWYALPAPAKLLFDHWSGWFDAAETGFADWAREKRVFLITTRADPDPTVPLAMEEMVKRSVTWLGMGWGGALHGIGDAPGDIQRDQSALLQAQGFLGRDNP